MRLLVLSEQDNLHRQVACALRREDHQITAASTTRKDAILQASNADLVVLDLAGASPADEGLSWCSRARGEGVQALVLVLTACGDVPHRLRVFDAGADDFLLKPFDADEFRLRIRALGRRRGVLHTTVLKHGESEANLTARRACRAGVEVMLTAREWGVLECLWAERGRVVPRSLVLQQLWGDTSKNASNSLEVLVGRIRKKIGSDWILTVRSEGYSIGL